MLQTIKLHPYTNWWQ